MYKWCHLDSHLLHHVTVPIDVHVALLICLPSSSFCISICVIHAYVYVNLYKHFPPLPHEHTTIAMSICKYVTIIVQWPLITLIFQLQYVSVYLLITVSPDVYTLTTPYSMVSISICIRAYVFYEYTHTMFIEKMFTPVCTSPSHMCVLKHILDPDLFHPYLFQKPEHVLIFTRRLVNPDKIEYT